MIRITTLFCAWHSTIEKSCKYKVIYQTCYLLSQLCFSWFSVMVIFLYKDQQTWVMPTMLQSTSTMLFPLAADQELHLIKFSGGLEKISLKNCELFPKAIKLVMRKWKCLSLEVTLMINFLSEYKFSKAQPHLYLNFFRRPWPWRNKGQSTPRTSTCSATMLVLITDNNSYLPAAAPLIADVQCCILLTPLLLKSKGLFDSLPLCYST